LVGVGGFSLEDRRTRAALTALWVSLVAGTLCACNLTGFELDNRPQDIIDKIRAIDLQPTSPRPREVPASNRAADPRRVGYEGNAVDVAADGGGASPVTPGADGFELSFENAPVTTVAKVILGDILGLGYTIDPRVQGTITLASGRPVPKSDVLYVLETALRINNVVLVRDTGGYKLVPAAEAVGGGNLDRTRAGQAPEPGFGITVVPLQYVSAQTLLKLLDGFAAKPNSVRADPGRNLLIIQGTSNERRSTTETVLSFDADWMRGQSVGIFPVHNSTPEPVIAEIEKILDTGEGGLSQGVVKLQAIARLNAILVVTRKPEVLRTVSAWVARLDASDASAVGVKVYRVRYGEARQMARILNEMFVTGAGGGASPLDTAATAPGSGSVSMTSGGLSGPGFAAGGLAGSGSSGAASIARPVLSNAPQSPTAGEQRTAGGGAAAAAGQDIAGATTRPAGAEQRALLPGVRITPDIVNNTLLIFANQESYRIIERTLNQIDRPQLQVSIEATIAEVTLNDKLNYGVQFFLKSSDLNLGVDKGSVINTIAAAPLAQVFPGFNLLLGAAAEPRVILDALHTTTDVKVLSNPSVVVLDNQVATLLVGDQIPVTTGTATVINSSNQVVSTIDYRNTGIILRVIPRINVNGNVVLDIEQEISNVAANTPIGSLTPTVSQRKVKSSIAVATGQTVLLAGLISDNRTRDGQGVPLVDQVPWLGNLFSHSTKSNTRTELIIFIRPLIIRDGVDAHYVAEELRAKMTGHRTVLGPGRPAVPPLVAVPAPPPGPRVAPAPTLK
jgi:general secretion pathway protein D